MFTMKTASSTPLIAVHDGSHHADDVFGVAILAFLHPGARLVRTRNPELIETADFVVDVGGVWDPEAGRFDHHQKGFEGMRPSGVVYASAGLVWRTHGIAFLNRIADMTDAEAFEIHQRVDDELIQHLDMADTGAAAGAEGRFGISMMIDAFNLTRVELDLFTPSANWGKRVDVDLIAQNAAKEARNETAQRYQLDFFNRALQLAQAMLVRVCIQCLNAVRSEAIVRQAPTMHDGQTLVLPVAGLDWISVVCASMPDVRFVVYPDSAGEQYQVRTVPVAPESFVAKRDLPAAWAGLRDESLVKATGVVDAVFCHNARFIAGAQSQAGAIELARLAGAV